MAGGERGDEGTDAVLQQSVYSPREGGCERAGLHDDDQSRFDDLGESETEGRKRARHLFRGRVCDIRASNGGNSRLGGVWGIDELLDI